MPKRPDRRWTRRCAARGRRVTGKGPSRVAEAFRERVREDDGVLDGEGRALREIGKNRMNCIAEESDPAARPAVKPARR